MQPTFKVNELVLVKCSNNATEYSIGDIITYYDKTIDIDVTHRIVEILGEEFYTQGDGNNTRDLNPVSKDIIIGKVIYNSFFLGNLYVKYRYIIIILIIIFVIAINILSSTIKNIKKENVRVIPYLKKRRVF